MFAKGLACGPFRIESVEDFPQSARWDAGSLILHGQADRASRTRLESEGNLASLWREGHGISKQIVENLDNSVSPKFCATTF